MIILRKEAEEDIRLAYEWYENQRKNLGLAFLIEIDSIFTSIEEQPEAHPECFKDARRALCRKFPYAIYYVRASTDIVILAILHQRRNPGFTRQRLGFNSKK